MAIAMIRAHAEANRFESSQKLCGMGKEALARVDARCLL
jgi:hypothetical protein